MAKSKVNGLVEKAFNPDKVLKEGVKLADYIKGINIDGLHVGSDKAEIVNGICHVPMQYMGVDINFQYKQNGCFGAKSISFSRENGDVYNKNFGSYSDLAHVKTQLCDKFLNKVKYN